MSEAEVEMLVALAEQGPASCAWMGSLIYGRRSGAVQRQPQAYCRPAGKVLCRLKALGFAREVMVGSGRDARMRVDSHS